MITKTIYKTKDYSKVKFLVAHETAETIAVMGLNNDWEKGVILSKKKDGSFTAEVQLPKNTSHEFKYLVNNQDWLLEEEADGTVANSFGSTNSLVTV
jgi:1,4-alpha-glucan branching enzyme